MPLLHIPVRGAKLNFVANKHENHMEIAMLYLYTHLYIQTKANVFIIILDIYGILYEYTILDIILRICYVYLPHYMYIVDLKSTC
jgi:hypothetical protein